MIAILMSTLFFLLLIWLGNVLMFLQTASYVFVPCFVFCLLVCTQFYKEANCKSLEGKDFLICLAMVILFGGLSTLLQKDFALTDFCYLYLCTFLAFIMFADSKRFKSLM